MMLNRNATKNDRVISAGVGNNRINIGSNNKNGQNHIGMDTSNAINQSNNNSAPVETASPFSRDGSRPLRNDRGGYHNNMERHGVVSRTPGNRFTSMAMESSQGYNNNRGTEMSGPEQHPINGNSNNHRDWHPKSISKPRLNGPQNRSLHYDNRDRWQNQYRNNSQCNRGGYHNNNLNNSPNNNYRPPGNYNSNRNWQPDRYYPRQNNFRHNIIPPHTDGRINRISEATNQNNLNDHRSSSTINNSEKRGESKNELEDKSVNQKADHVVKPQNSSESSESPAKSRRKSHYQETTAKTISNKPTEVGNGQKGNCIKSITQINDKSIDKRSEENSQSSGKTTDISDLNQTYPKIQVRPLTELLQQEKTEIIKENRLAEKPSSTPSKAPNQQKKTNVIKENCIAEKSTSTPTKVPTRPGLRIPRRSTISNCRDNVINFNDRLARMDKESLKYIINNSDTIFEEQLQAHARQRICEQISRRLKGIVLEKPKEKPATEVIEDDIVDASKLPELFLKEIESCFGINIVAKHNDQNNQKEGTDQMIDSNARSAIVKSENCTNEQQDTEKLLEEFSIVDKEVAKETHKSDPVINPRAEESIEKTDLNTECAKNKDNNKEQVLQVIDEVQAVNIKRKSSKENQQEQTPTKKHKDFEESNKESENNVQNSPKKKQSENTDILTDSMAKKRSNDLMVRLKVAEEFKSGSEDNVSLLDKPNKRGKKSPQKERPKDDDVDKSSDTEIFEVEIKKEPRFRSTTPVPTYVISSSEDEVYNGDEDDDEIANNDDNISDYSNTSNSTSSFSKSHYNQKLQSDVVVDTFEKLILPHLQQQLGERYREKHSLYARLQFIFCVVTSSQHNPQIFSNTEITKIQKNLKENNNRTAIEFLLKQIVNVAATQRRKEQEEQRVANAITPTKSAELAEVPHQRNIVDVSPPPPTPSPSCQNAPSSMSCLRQQPYNLPSSMQLQLGMDSSLARLPMSNCYPLLAGGEANTESCYGQFNDSVTQSLLEIDRRLMEYQNRRSFLDEIIMKFQKEKSDLEMLTLEMHSRKFLILNTVLSKNQTGSTPSQATISPTATPINTPPPNLESISTELNLPSPPTVTTTTKESSRRDSDQVNKSKRFLRNARRKSRSKINKLNKQNADTIKKTQNSATIPKPMSAKIKEDPEEETLEMDEVSVAVTPAKKLCVTKSNPSQQQQPLAIIPPLPPPPPPPEPIVNMSYVSPQGHPNRTQKVAGSPDLACVPNGRLHNISYPITQIRIYKIYIIASSEDGDIYMFNITNHKLERQITKHSEAITNMYLCEKGSNLYTTSLDGFLKKSSLENLERVMQTVYFKEPLQSIDLAWGLAFIGSRWGNLFTFDVMTNKVMDPPLLSTGQSIIAVKATKEGPRKIVILGCKGNFVYMHDATTGLLLRRLTLPDELNVYSLLLNDGHVYCGTQKNEIYKFDFASGTLVDKVNCGNGAVSIVTYGEKYILAGCYDGFIYVLDKLRCKQMGRFEGAGRMVLALAIAGDKIVTSSKDKSLVVLEIPKQMINTEQQQ